MTSSERSRSNRLHGPQPTPTTPAPAARNTDAARSGNLYTRFIPREELGTFANWAPGALGADATPVERRSANGDRRASPPPAATPTPAPGEALAALQKQHAAALKAARQAGYQDGYRDGLVALDNFKQSFAQQITAQVGQLFEACGLQLESMQERMAGAITESAALLARQVVRQELKSQPELIVAVARDTVEAVLASARDITLRLHPDDQAVVAQGASELFERRGVRLVGDATMTRGGCELHSDIGVVDATVETRWIAAATRLGQAHVVWTGSSSGPAPAQAAAAPASAMATSPASTPAAAPASLHDGDKDSS